MLGTVLSRHRRALLAGAALTAALVVAYAGSFRGGFLWDDDLHITANPTIIGPLGLKEIWTTARANYFPLVLTNFWAQHAVWGLEPVGYRVVTLAFHAVAALLLWRVLARLGVPGAWLGAALWALHPVQVESVAWICELKNTQSAVFFLAAILAWLRWIDPAAGERPRGRDYAAALLFAALAILSKPSTVMLPVALGLCVWRMRGWPDWRGALRLAPFFALSAVAAGWTIWEQKFHSGAIGPEWSQTPMERIALAGRVAWFYLGKLIWPEPLIFIYPRWEIDATQPVAYLGTLALVAGLVALAWRAWRARLGGLGLAAMYFAALLFPVMGFFSVYFFRYSFVGDHFQYLASMGPLALAGALVARAAPRAWPAAGALLLAALGLGTARHAGNFLSSEALWRHTVARNPAAVMAWLNLGDTLARRGRYEEAITTFRRALEMKPADPMGWNDLGNTLVLAGRPAEAVAPFERAIELKPDFAAPRSNLGNALRDLGRLAEAEGHLRRALEIEPGDAGALNNLGALLAETGRGAEAVGLFERALRARPDDVATLDNLAGALREAGRVEEALGRHAEALRLAPGRAESRANFGRTLAAAGRHDEAVTALSEALRLKPGLPHARHHLALAHEAAGRHAEALRVWEEDAALAPASAEAQINLGVALARRGRTEEAIARFQMATRAQPGMASAHANLGNALGARGRWREAAAAFSTAVELRPEVASARVQLAIALVNDGRLAEAVGQFEAAIRLAPGVAETRENFAQVLIALGRRREAGEQLEEASRLRRESRR